MTEQSKLENMSWLRSAVKAFNVNQIARLARCSVEEVELSLSNYGIECIHKTEKKDSHYSAEGLLPLNKLPFEPEQKQEKQKEWDNSSVLSDIEWMKSAAKIMTIGQIADYTGVSRYIVQKKLIAYNITVSRRRPAHYKTKNKPKPTPSTIKKVPKVKFPQLHDRDFIYQQYINLNKNLREIKDIIGCSHQAVSLALRKLNIPIRSTGSKVRSKDKQLEYKKKFAKKFPKLFDSEYLQSNYLKDGASIKSLSKDIGCHYIHIKEAFEKHGIQIKSKSIRFSQLPLPQGKGLALLTCVRSINSI